MLRDFVLGILVGRTIGDEVVSDETGIERASRRKNERRRANRLDRLLSVFRPSSEVVSEDRPEKSMNLWVVVFCWFVIAWGLYSFWRAFSLSLH